MLSVLQLFFRMVHLRARPQDLPASDLLLIASGVLAVLATVLAARPFYPPALGAARAGLDLVVQAGVVLAALQWKAHPERFRQTFSALCGTGAILTLLAAPLYPMLAGEPTDPMAGAAVLVLLAIYIWATVVTGHIFRHAFDLRLGIAIGVALLYVILTAVIGETLLPPPESV